MESCEITSSKDGQQSLKTINETKKQLNGEVNNKNENVDDKTNENNVVNKMKQGEEVTLSNGINKTEDASQKRTPEGSGSQSPILNAAKTSNTLPSNITEALEQQLTPILEACVNNNGNIAHLQQQLAAAVSQVTVSSNAGSSVQSPGLASQSPQRTSNDTQTAASMLAAQLSIAVANAVNKTNNNNKTSPSNQMNKSNEVSPSSWSQQQQTAASKNAEKSPANPSTTKLTTNKANNLSSTIQSLNQLTQLVGCSNNNSSTMQQALNSIYSPNQLMKSFNNNSSTNGVASKPSNTSSANGQYRANIYTESNGEIDEQSNTTSGSGKTSNGAFDMSMLNTQLLDLLRQDPSQIEQILKLKSLYQMGGGEDSGVASTGFLEELQQLDPTVPANMAVVAAAVALAQQQSANGTANASSSSSSNGPSVSTAAAALASSLHQTNLTQQLNNLGLNNLNSSGVNVINNRVNGGIGNSPRSTLNMIQGFQQSNNSSQQNSNFTPNTKQQYQFSQQQNHHNNHQFNSHHHSNNSNGHHGNHIAHHNSHHHHHHHHHQPSSGGQQQHYQYNMMHMSLQQQQQHLQQQQQLNQDFHEERFSRKVFVGGLPPDIDEDEIVTHFRRYGNLIVDWPHKAESKSYFPPKGYAFLIFQEERSVQDLIETCVMDDGKLYMVVSSPSMKDKPVQIRPWCLADSDFVMDGSQPLDPRKTIFVGGVPRPLKAIELAMIMDRFYGGVCYAGIDTDPELKYPKGAGRVAFSNQQSYIAAISARFVQLQHGEIDKRVEVKPYVLDDQMCDECQGARCGGKFAPFFCANVTCLQYYCEVCWATIHTRPGREYHKPLVKEGADRPRPIPYK